jgi:predicted dehydrogenase
MRTASSSDAPGIGIIGVGGVARYAHLPAYAALGLNVQALCDTDPEMLQRVAGAFGVAARTTDAVALVRDPRVAVVDIATPPASHCALVELAAAHGKPALVQKPLCCTPDEFDRVRRLRSSARLRLNLTGREVSAWRKVRELLGSGALGRPLFLTIVNRDWWDRREGGWEQALDQFILFEMVIHHLDLCLFWFGPPARVAARTGSHSRQSLSQPNWASVMLEYGSGLVVQIVDDWTLSEFAFATGHPLEQVMLSAEHGAVRATSERVEWSSLGDNAIRTWHLPRPGQRLPGEQLEVNWFPDSFGRSMRGFLDSLHDSRAASEDWRHIEELTELTFAVADAARSDRWVDVDPHVPHGISKEEV